MWETAVGFKYERGYGMQQNIYTGDLWMNAYLSLCDAFKTITGECIDDIYNIEQNKPCEIVDDRLPEQAPPNAIGVVYVINNSYASYE